VAKGRNLRPGAEAREISDYSDEENAEVQNHVQLGRLGFPEESTQMAVLLAKIP
jgi:hypothetical protein